MVETVVSKSPTSVLIETFMTDWSRTITNCAVARATSGHHCFIRSPPRRAPTRLASDHQDPAPPRTVESSRWDDSSYWTSKEAVLVCLSYRDQCLRDGVAVTVGSGPSTLRAAIELAQGGQRGLAPGSSVGRGAIEATRVRTTAGVTEQLVAETPSTRSCPPHNVWMNAKTAMSE